MPYKYCVIAFHLLHRYRFIGDSSKFRAFIYIYTRGICVSGGQRTAARDKFHPRIDDDIELFNVPRYPA